MKNNILIYAAAALLLTACGAENTPEMSRKETTTTTGTSITEQTSARETTTETTTTTHPAYDDALYDDGEPLDEEYEESPSLLSSTEDIGLYDTDGGGWSYCFTYNGEEFNAQYTTDNWKIIDSYKITDHNDMVIICEALSEIYQIHGSDMESWRTPEDMAYEWEQHNLAYSLLADGEPWKENAKDVDINPADQGKSLYELYKDRTGKELDY